MENFKEIYQIEIAKKMVTVKKNNNFDEYIARVCPEESKKKQYNIY